VIVVPLSILGGIIAALNRGRAVDRILSTTSLSLSTVPEFVSGVVLIVVFALGFKVLPVSANARPVFVHHPAEVPDPSSHPAGFHPLRLHSPDGPGGHDRALDSDYVRTATLKGLPRWL